MYFLLKKILRNQPSEDWIQCHACEDWFHEKCAEMGENKIPLICDLGANKQYWSHYFIIFSILLMITKFILFRKFWCCLFVVVLNKYSECFRTIWVLKCSLSKWILLSNIYSISIWFSYSQKKWSESPRVCYFEFLIRYIYNTT